MATMNDPAEKARKSFVLLEEAILDVLQTVFPDAMGATETRDALGNRDPARGFRSYLVVSLIKRLEERGCVEQKRARGPWKVTVT